MFPGCGAKVPTLMLTVFETRRRFPSTPQRLRRLRHWGAAARRPDGGDVARLTSSPMSSPNESCSDHRRVAAALPHALSSRAGRNRGRASQVSPPSGSIRSSRPQDRAADGSRCLRARVCTSSGDQHPPVCPAVTRPYRGRDEPDPGDYQVWFGPRTGFFVLRGPARPADTIPCGRSRFWFWPTSLPRSCPTPRCTRPCRESSG